MTNKFIHKLKCDGCPEPIVFDYANPNHLVLWDVKNKKDYRFHNKECLKKWSENEVRI